MDPVVGVEMMQVSRCKDKCVDCNGSSICPHGSRKYRCIPCDGNGVCAHKTQRRRCYICDPIQEGVQRLHYTNTQLLWAWQNAEKGNSYIGPYDPDK